MSDKRVKHEPRTRYGKPMTPREERIERDAFYGGFCVALQAWNAVYGDNGIGTAYLEAVAIVDRRELLSWARRNDDPELRNIRRAIRWLEKEEARERERSNEPSA